MPDQFVVPQFIDVEDKILGPLTVRQFVVILAVFGIDFLLYKLTDFVTFLLFGLPIFAFGITLAFVKINGQPFHLYLLNVLQYTKRPKVKVWNKAATDQEIREYIAETPPPPPPQRIRKEAPTSSRLSEISLIVNTGGVYRTEEDERL